LPAEFSGCSRQSADAVLPPPARCADRGFRPERTPRRAVSGAMVLASPKVSNDSTRRRQVARLNRQPLTLDPAH